MLILPIVSENRVMNVRIKIKNAEKIKSHVLFSDAIPSDIIVNREKFSESIYNNSKDPNAPIDFVRSKSILYPRSYLITTKEEADSTFYDVYAVSQPPKKVNDSLDLLYSKALTDMRKEIPGSNKRGRYISLEKIGVGKSLTEEKIAELQRIVKEVNDSSRWPRLFEEAGIADLKDTIDFISLFDCTVVSDTTIPEDSIQDVLKALEVINSRDSRSLRNYYNTAIVNKDIYSKLSYISRLIYNRPLNLIRSDKEKQKQLVKVKDTAIINQIISRNQSDERDYLQIVA